jgi:hypothetical protein
MDRWNTRYKLNVAQADLAWFDLSLDDTEMPKHLPFLDPDLDCRSLQYLGVSIRSIYEIRR